MNQNTEPFYFLILIFSFGTVWFANLIYSPIHKYLRDKKIYFWLLGLAIVMLVVSVNLIEPQWESHEKTNALSPINFISYLLLYKIADFIAKKKYNRNVYFSCRLSDWIKDDEASKSTILETVLQFSISLLSLLSLTYLGNLFFGTKIF